MARTGAANSALARSIRSCSSRHAKDEPFRLPDLDLRLIDARGRMDTDYGLVGLKLDGGGNLRGGFGGTLAAVAPRAAVAGCGIAGRVALWQTGSRGGTAEVYGASAAARAALAPRRA